MFPPTRKGVHDIYIVEGEKLESMHNMTSFFCFTQREPKCIIHSQSWWLMPIIPTHWEANMGSSPEVRSLRPAWPIWYNPISTKNTKVSQV